MNHVALCPQHLDILSICTGGGGLDLGVELAIPSARSVVLVEREAFAAAQLVSAMEAGLLHQAPIWSDARTFDGQRWRGCVDGLIGGIPCQGHSLAGKKRGSLDERDIWSPARRIIVQARPWFVLIENVGGMLSPGDDDIAGAERVRRDLLKLGFSVEGGLFTASEVGASHERERIFILAVADAGDARSQRRELSRPSGERDWPQTSGSIAELRRASLDDTIGGRRPARRLNHRGNDGYELDATGEDALGDAPGQRSYAATFAGADSGDEGGRPRHAEFERRGGALGDATCDGRREGRPEHELSEWRRPAATVTGSSMADAAGQREWPMAERQPSADEADLDADRSGEGYLFPPGPSDSENWQAALERAPELEPAFRRVADGLASRLDIARVDRLRMLGNGVVPLQAAFAIRTLAERLAKKGHDRLWKLCQQ